MSWVGLRDRKDGTYCPAGLGQTSQAPVDLNGILPCGTLMVEFGARPTAEGQMILDYKGTSPWVSGLSLSLGETGILTLTQTQGTSVRVFALPTGIASRTSKVTCTFTWDAPAKSAVMSVEIAETGRFLCAEMQAPLPMSLRDAVRIVADPRQSQMSPHAVFVAVADTVMPHGPLPTLGSQTLIPTPTGAMPVYQIKAGQLITTAHGDTAQVRWVGSVDLPARGRFAPMRLRAPYHGATRDIVCSPGQRLRFSGSAVEYLFAKEVVSVGVGQLSEGVVRQTSKRPFTQRYYQIMLDRPDPILTGGLTLDTFVADAILKDDILRRNSVLAALPVEVLPTRFAPQSPLLHDIEALTLCRLRAA